MGRDPEYEFRRISMKSPNVVGNFLWNLSTHQNYEDGSNKSQNNQHKHRDLHGKNHRGERFHYNNGDYNDDSLVC